MGDDLRVPRKTEFFFYGGDFTGLAAAASCADIQPC
jgi:hypothetical protein